MSYSTAYTDVFRHNLDRLFTRLANGRGILECEFFAVDEPATRQNIYHDVTDKSGDAGTGVYTLCFIELNPAIKVVKDLGWWKEEESLPILMYMLYQDNYVPERDAKVVIDASDGYMADSWIIKAVKAFAQGVPVAWVCNVVPTRN